MTAKGNPDTGEPVTEPEEDGPDAELVNILEAAIFAADEPVGVRKLIAMFPRDAAPTRIDIQNAILKLQETYEGRGIELRRIGKGWRFQSREKYSEWLRPLFAGKAPRYSRALLETLAIIAYRQPVTRAEIEEIRGVSVSSDTIRILLEREWIQQVGHRDVPGRPALFATTDGFLQYFNLTSLKDLPELLERRDIGEIASELNLELPIEGGEPVADSGDDADEEHRAEVIPLHPEDDAGEDIPEPDIGEPSDEQQPTESADTSETPREGEDP